MTHNDTIIVQRLRAEVARKTQKYSRIAAQEFPPFQAYEMFMDSIKSACRKRYKILPSMCCNVLAGENGPSCFSTKQIPDFKITCTSSEELKHHKGNSTHHQGKIILRRDVEYCLFPNLKTSTCRQWFGHVPDLLKQSIINPLPKVSPPQEIQSDLRPISLTCTLAKKC